MCSGPPTTVIASRPPRDPTFGPTESFAPTVQHRPTELLVNRHGRFTGEAIERRRELNALIRMLSDAAEEVV